MHITWNGHYTIVIQSNGVNLVLDPHSAETGLAPLRGSANIVALTNPSDPSMSNVESLKGEPFVIDRPGEYSVSGFGLKAIGWKNGGEEKNLQRWTIEGMVLLHVGALDRALEEVELQELEKTNIDVLFLPIGGLNSLNTKDALALLTVIEPRIVIPIHYKIPKIKEDLEDAAQFIREVGAESNKVERKLLLKANKLPEEGMLTVILQP